MGTEDNFRVKTQQKQRKALILENSSQLNLKTVHIYTDQTNFYNFVKIYSFSILL